MTNMMKTKYTRKTNLQRTLNYLLTGFTETPVTRPAELETPDISEFLISPDIVPVSNSEPGYLKRFQNKFSSLLGRIIYKQALKTVSPADNLEFESSIHIRKPQNCNGNYLKYLDQPKFIE